MPQPVKIDIVVDTVKLQTDYPGGGEITTEGIIEMTQNGGKAEYQDNNKAKLISSVKPGTAIKWKIKSKAGGENVDFVDYKGDGTELKVFKSKPSVNKSSKTDCDGDVKEDMPQQTVSTNYTFNFCLKKNPTKIWNWDPKIIVPYPP